MTKREGSDCSGQEVTRSSDYVWLKVFSGVLSEHLKHQPTIQRRSSTNHSSIRTWLYFGLDEALEASRPFERFRDETAEMLQPPGEALSVKKPPDHQLQFALNANEDSDRAQRPGSQTQQKIRVWPGA